MTFSQYVPAFSSENKPYTFSVGWLTKYGKKVIIKKRGGANMMKFIKSLFSKKLDKNDLELLAICETHRS